MLTSDQTKHYFRAAQYFFREGTLHPDWACGLIERKDEIGVHLRYRKTAADFFLKAEIISGSTIYIQSNESDPLYVSRKRSAWLFLNEVKNYHKIHCRDFRPVFEPPQSPTVSQVEPLQLSNRLKRQAEAFQDMGHTSAADSLQPFLLGGVNAFWLDWFTKNQPYHLEVGLIKTVQFVNNPNKRPRRAIMFGGTWFDLDKFLKHYTIYGNRAILV